MKKEELPPLRMKKSLARLESVAKKRKSAFLILSSVVGKQTPAAPNTCSACLFLANLIVRLSLPSYSVIPQKRSQILPLPSFKGGWCTRPHPFFTAPFGTAAAAAAGINGSGCGCGGEISAAKPREGRRDSPKVFRPFLDPRF